VNSFLLTIAAALVLALSAAFAVPYFVDWNDYRHVFEGQASKLIGRPVFVGGDVRLRLLPTPLVSFDEVRIADARGQIDTPFAQAKSFSMWLALPPLLQGTLEARGIEIDEPTINLRVLPDGGANWRDMGRREDALVFKATDVAMESVEITGGTIAVYRQGKSAPIRIEDITGELSARSLEGPYKFAGTVKYDGVERDLKFSTGGPQENGGMRFKSVVREQEGADSYSIDGTLAGLNATPRFEGQVEARIGQAAQSGESDAGETGGPLAALEIKSQVNAGLNQATFDGLEIIIRRNEKPQTLKGQLTLAWHDALAATGTMSSLWLDLDALSLGKGEPPKSAGEAVSRLTRELLAESAGIGQGRLELNIQKAQLAGEIVSDIHTELEVTGKNLRVNDLTATLPGPNELNLSGALRGTETGPEFQGVLALSGNHMSRLVKWAGIEQQNLATSDGTDFALNARVTYGPDKLLLEDAKGTLLGSAYAGALQYQTGDRRLFTVELKSERLDLTKAFGTNASVGNLVKLLADRDTADAAVSPTVAQYAVAGWLERGEARVDLSIGSVTLPGFEKANLAAKFSLMNGDLTIHRLNLRSGKGLTMRAEGGLADLDARPDGRIMLTADAAGPNDIKALWTLLELPSRDMIAERAQALAPMKVALAIESKRRSGGGLEARLGGAVGASNLALTAKFQGELAAYDQGQIDIDGTVSNSNGVDLLLQLFPHLSADKLGPFKAKRAVATLNAQGAIGGSLSGNAILEAEGLRWQIEGEADGTKGLSLAGQTTIDTQDAALALTLVGLDMGRREEPAPMAIKASLSRKDQAIQLSKINGVIDGGQFGGDIRLDLSGETPVIDAEITTAQTSLGSLLRPVVDWSVRPKRRAKRSRRQAQRSRWSLRRRQAQANPAPPPPKPKGPLWSDRPFKPAMLASVKGTLALRSDSLQLVEALVLKDAELKAKLSNGRLEITELKGGLYDGRAEIEGALTAKEKGMSLVANASLKQAHLERATSVEGAPALADGTLDIEINLAGEGLTPKGLVSALEGGGRLALASGSVRGLSPDALKQTAVAEVDAEISRGSTLPGRVREGFQQAVFSVEPVEADFAIQEGTVRLEDLVLKDAKGQATLKSYLELASFKVDSEWKVEADPNDEAADDIEVTMVFAGKLEKFGAIKPSINTEILKRYINVQRIARSVEQKALREGQAPSADGQPPAPAAEATPETPPAAQPPPQAPAAATAARRQEPVVEPPAAQPPPQAPAAATAARRQEPVVEPPAAQPPPQAPAAATASRRQEPVVELPAAQPPPQAPAAAQPRQPAPATAVTRRQPPVAAPPPPATTAARPQTPPAAAAPSPPATTAARPQTPPAAAAPPAPATTVTRRQSPPAAVTPPPVSDPAGLWPQPTVQPQRRARQAVPRQLAVPKRAPRPPQVAASPPPAAVSPPPASDPAGLWQSTTSVGVPANNGSNSTAQSPAAEQAPPAESVAPPPQPAQPSRPRPRWTGPGRFEDFSEFSQ